MIKTSIGTWKPESTSGLVMIDGGGRQHLENKDKTFTKEQIKKFIEYYHKVKKREYSGEQPKSWFKDKLEGYIDRLEKNLQYKIKFTHTKSQEQIECWNCDTKYPANWCKCLKCKSFNKDDNKNKSDEKKNIIKLKMTRGNIRSAGCRHMC